MSLSDLINGGFEGLAAFAILQHCQVLNRDKRVAGLSIPAIVFFTTWGFWNMFYYPSLGQLFSAICGSLVCVANCYYVYLLLKYRSNK